MRRNIKLATLSLAALVLFFICLGRYTACAEEISPWGQVKRRLFDDDVPKKEKRTNRNYDMTDI